MTSQDAPRVPQQDGRSFAWAGTPDKAGVSEHSNKEPETIRPTIHGFQVQGGQWSLIITELLSFFY